MVQPAVAIVIVTWNSASTIGACLESLRDNPPAGDWQAVVVDNNSSDGTREIVTGLATSMPVLLIANADNLGLAAANNQGIRATEAAAVVISNPDVVYRPGSVDAMTGLLERHPRAAFAIARLLHPDGSLQVSVGDLPSLTESLVGHRWAAKVVRGSRGMWWQDWDHKAEVTVGHGQEACYAVRTEAVRDVGLQDPEFWLDWEGVDWAARMQRRNWEIWFCPDAEVVHIGGVSIKKAKNKWIVSTHKGLYRYHSRRLPAAMRPPLAAVVAARAGAKLAATWLQRDVYGASHR